MIAWHRRSVADQDAASTIERGIRVRRGARTGWMSSPDSWRVRTTTTPGRGRTRIVWGMRMKVLRVSNPRSPSSAAAVSPASAAERC